MAHRFIFSRQCECCGENLRITVLSTGIYSGASKLHEGHDLWRHDFDCLKRRPEYPTALLGD